MRRPPVVILVLTVLSGCLADSPESASIDEQEARELLVELRDMGYRQWARAPGLDTRADAVGPHGAFADVFIDSTVEAALGEKDLEAWPLGSILVCDGWSSEQGARLETIGIARKDQGGWWWALFDASDRVLAAGEVEACISCHAAGDDFVMSVALP